MNDGAIRLRFTATVIFVALFFVFAPGVYAQKQLVLLKKQKVILRLSYGDDITYKTKGSKDKITSYVNNLFDTAVMAHMTVVPFHQIERLYFKRSGFLNKIGGALVVGGVGYFAIDQVNEIIVKGEKATLNENVTTASVVMVAVGLPTMLIKKKSQRLKHGYRLLTVDRYSHFYHHELEHMSF
ncbi:MAG TPA: hypothetical protein VK666_09325 [Chryseolinea sp.]|nr:hypothetical protein [Chryseolinea sp.]